MCHRSPPERALMALLRGSHGSGYGPRRATSGSCTAVAAIYGVFESGIAGRPVTMDEMLSGAVDAYQQDVDAALGLT